MSEYQHRMSLAVPQALIIKANQLALIVGESSDDDKTFTAANWQDKDGNLYAVCSTVIKPVVLNAFGAKLADYPLRPHAINADVAQAQAALDKVVMYSEGLALDNKSIIVGVDIEPLTMFERLGLAVIESDLI